MARLKGKKKRRRRPVREPRRPRGLAAFFLRGLVTLLPPVLTVVIFGLLYQMIERYVTGPINRTIYWSLERNAVGWSALDRLGIDPLATTYLDQKNLSVDLQELIGKRSLADEHVRAMLANERDQHLGFFRNPRKLAIDADRLRHDVADVVDPIYGILISLLLILWLGWLVGGFVGRRIVQGIDQTMRYIPVVRAVYPYSKQLVEFFFAEKKLEFETVVAVPYPSPGLWAIGFVTGRSLRTLRDEMDDELVTVFIPSSPMPMTGYTVFLKADNVIPLPITVDEALRITMTGGVLVPPAELVGEPGDTAIFEDGLPTDYVETGPEADDEEPAPRDEESHPPREERA